MPSIHDNYESKHRQNLNRLIAEVEARYDTIIENVIRGTVGLNATAPVFRVTDFPALNTLLTLQIESFVRNIEALVLNGITTEWGLSSMKFNDISGSEYGPLSEAIRASIDFPQRRALAAFQNRTIDGLKISDRIWQVGNQLRAELEKTLYVGIKKGTSANDLARDATRFLKEPNRLDAEVLEAAGEFDLSRQAKAYKPGPGIYKTSFANAQRLTRNEINGAYRTADMTRWENTPFVLGYRTRLSNRHPRYDICDPMANEVFPTSFVWTGWHVNCLCSAIPVLATKEDYLKFEDAILSGDADGYEFEQKVKDLPPAFVEYMKKNADTFSSWSRPPAFLSDNPGVAKEYLK